MTNKFYIIVSFLSAAFFTLETKAHQCMQHEDVTFEKIIGVKPSQSSIYANSVFTIRHGEAPSMDWLTLECVKTCKYRDNCHSLIVLYNKLECHGLPKLDIKSLTVDNDASFYIKICMHVPNMCRSKLWSVESSVGYHLLVKDTDTRMVNNITGEECSRLLMQNLDGVQIGSAQFQLPHKDANGYIFDGNDIENIPTAKGMCALNVENKFTQPESYRVANTDTVYKENQCYEHLSKDINRCSYEEYYNQTLKHYDVIIHGISTLECKNRCSNEVQFNCRGFTTVPYENKDYNPFGTNQNNDSDSKVCLLHSEDILSLGSWLLTKKVDAVYYRRVPCLNITVECSASAMTITYWPRSDFYGRLYVSGYSETCSTNGQGKNRPTKLNVPFTGTSCGINQAYALTDDRGNGENRTLMYALLVVQNNPIIQAQGDRFIRAGCVAPPAFNLTLGTAINVGNESEDQPTAGNLNGHSPIPASSIINTTASSRLPKVKMYIINEPDEFDQLAQSGVGAVALGDAIELRIEMDSNGTGDVDIHAYHLVASSQLGDNSVLLLDGRGCPTGQVDFPPLRKIRTNDFVRLTSRFKAFRFPNSHVVKFSVMVQYCSGNCPQVICDGGVIQSRQSRSLNTTKGTVSSSMQMENSTVVEEVENATVTFVDNFRNRINSSRSAHVVVASSESVSRVSEICREANEGTRNKIPLELSLIVASNDVFTSDSLVYAENNKILVSGVEEPKGIHHNMICIHEALFITITFVWLIVQILILAGCLVVIKRYRSFIEDNRYHKDYHSFDNLGFDSVTTNRRVHWPDQNVDILHVN